MFSSSKRATARGDSGFCPVTMRPSWMANDANGRFLRNTAPCALATRSFQKGMSLLWPLRYSYIVVKPVMFLPATRYFPSFCRNSRPAIPWHTEAR